MLKTKDLFFGGAVAGLISGLVLDLWVFLLKLLGATARAPWDDTAALMFLKPEYDTIPAKLIAWPVSLITPMLLGIILAMVLRRFGRDYVYFKSIFLSQVGTFFTLIIVYPSLGFELLKHSVSTFYAAFIGMFPFGLVLGYIVKSLVDFDPP